MVWLHCAAPRPGCSIVAPDTIGVQQGVVAGTPSAAAARLLRYASNYADKVIAAPRWGVALRTARRGTHFLLPSYTHTAAFFAALPLALAAALLPAQVVVPFEEAEVCT